MRAAALITSALAGLLALGLGLVWLSAAHDVLPQADGVAVTEAQAREAMEDVATIVYVMLAAGGAAIVATVLSWVGKGHLAAVLLIAAVVVCGVWIPGWVQVGFLQLVLVVAAVLALLAWRGRAAEGDAAG